MISLGDTFGDDHTPLETTSEDMKLLHLDYRQYLGQVCHSMPFLFCLGNHEGESGYWLDQNPPIILQYMVHCGGSFTTPIRYPTTFTAATLLKSPGISGFPKTITLLPGAMLFL
jgi:hypothetical protein